MSYRIKHIKGKPFDADMLETVEKLAGDSRLIRKDGVAKLFCVAMDAGRLTGLELDTFQHIRRTRRFTKEARQLMDLLVQQARALELEKLSPHVLLIREAQRKK